MDTVRYSEDGKVLIEAPKFYRGVLEIPYGVKRIASNAFEKCEGSFSVALPDSLVEIEEYAFYGCIGLQNIEIPDSVKEIGNSAFSGCKELLYVKLPQQLQEISHSLFYECNNLRDLDIPNSVQTIGKCAFDGCWELQRIIIPSSVTYIDVEEDSFGGSTFSRCFCLRSIIVDQNNPVYDSRERCNAIIKTKTNTLLVGCRDTIIPNSIVKIANNAFDCRLDLNRISIPDSVNEIGDSAFFGCEELEQVQLPKSLKVIAGDTFNCCRGLSIINIPKTVMYIKEWAFSECNNITAIYFESVSPENIKFDKLAFADTDLSKTTIYVPVGAEHAYRQHPLFFDLNICETERDFQYQEFFNQLNEDETEEFDEVLDFDDEDEMDYFEEQLAYDKFYSEAEKRSENLETPQEVLDCADYDTEKIVFLGTISNLDIYYGKRRKRNQIQVLYGPPPIYAYNIETQKMDRTYDGIDLLSLVDDLFHQWLKIRKFRKENRQ